MFFAVCFSFTAILLWAFAKLFDKRIASSRLTGLKFLEKTTDVQQVTFYHCILLFCVFG